MEKREGADEKARLKYDHDRPRIMAKREVIGERGAS
jgi:hypothetical protein